MAGIARIVLITGGIEVDHSQIKGNRTDNCVGNSGIGFEAANQLLRAADTHVIIGSRSEQKGRAALHDLKSRNQSGSVELINLDVTEKASIEAAVRSVESQHGR